MSDNLHIQRHRIDDCRKQGFTLIELLIVIAIIGILSTVGLVALNGARAKARDLKRVLDLRQYALAYQFFFDTKNNYWTACDIGTRASQCPDLQTFFGAGSIYPDDPSGSTTELTYGPGCPNAPNCCTGNTDPPLTVCQWGSGWRNPGGPRSYTIAFESSAEFALAAYFEYNSPGVGGAGVSVLRDDGIFCKTGLVPNPAC